jgi:DNA-binding beta-propeller fold protein YncE
MSSQLIVLCRRLRAWVTIALSLLLLILAALPARSQATSATVPAAPEPFAVAVNTKTNKIYVLHQDTPTVSVIDGPTDTVTTFTDPGGVPRAVAAEPLSNKIYLVNSNNVTVFDGATNSSTTLADPNTVDLGAVAVNPLTHKIYATNPFGVTVIDEVSNSSTTVTDRNAMHPVAVDLNPRTNRIYVANFKSHNVTVIDGTTNSTTTVTDPSAVQPVAVAVNPVTNKIYVANVGLGSNRGSITVIDGATNATTTVTDRNARAPNAVAVNPVTNKIYVVNLGTWNYTVIDGATNATTTVTDRNAMGSVDVAVNPMTNKVYVVRATFPGTGIVIDGATNATTTLTDLDAGHPLAVAAARAAAEQDESLGTARSDPVPETCPVTKPPSQPFVPPSPFSTDHSEGSFWFGTDRLWTRLRTDAKWPQGEKTFWWRQDWLPYHWIPVESAAKLKVTARRLDAPVPDPEIFRANSSYAGGPLLIGGINLTTTGCWQITAQYEHDELRFVVWVVK